PQPAQVARPQAGGQDQRRPRLVARQVDLDPERKRSPVHVLGPVDAQVVAARLEQRPRRRAELERQPLDLDLPPVLRRLARARLHLRVRADDVVVEANPLHGWMSDIKLWPPMRVAVAQLDPKLAEKERNLDACLARLDEAVAAGAELLVLPECAIPGY